MKHKALPGIDLDSALCFKPYIKPNQCSVRPLLHAHMSERKDEDRSITNGQHKVEEHESRVLHDEATDESTEEIERKDTFQNGRPGDFLADVFVALYEAVSQALNIELRRAYKSRFLTQISLEYGNGVVQRQAHRQGQEQREKENEFIHRSGKTILVLVCRALDIGYIVHCNDCQQTDEEISKEVLTKAHLNQVAQQEQQGNTENACDKDKHEYRASHEV